MRNATATESEGGTRGSVRSSWRSRSCARGGISRASGAAPARREALVAVVQEAYVNGVSTRKVDRLVEQMGVHMSKDQVSRLCRGLDEQVSLPGTEPLRETWRP